MAAADEAGGAARLQKRVQPLKHGAARVAERAGLRRIEQAGIFPGGAKVEVFVGSGPHISFALLGHQATSASRHRSGTRRGVAASP
jgi:hypothetical protein